MLAGRKKGCIPWNKGLKGPSSNGGSYGLLTNNFWRIATLEQKRAMIDKRAATMRGRPLSEVHRLSLCVPKKNTEKMSGENHYRWNPNRAEVRYDRRNDPEYKQWRKRVWLRDNFKCKIANQDCSGEIEAHHILNWVEYVELRYEDNNGITLCQAHHPRGRAEEKRLIPVLRELVPVSSNYFAKEFY